MNILTRVLCAVLLLVVATYSQAAPAYTDQIIVKYLSEINGISPRQQQDSRVGNNVKGKPSGLPDHVLTRMSSAARSQLEYGRGSGVAGAHVLNLPGKVTIAEANAIAADIMANDANVIYAVPEVTFTLAATTPSDTQYATMWNLHAATSNGINATSAWDITTGNPATVIAVLDTGILAHEDIDNSRILPGYDFISSAATARDGDGWDPDPTDEGDYAQAGDICYTGDPNQDKSSWHGLHVTGTIAATPNTIGVVGMDWSARILPVRVLGKCGGSSADIADAIMWAAGLPVPGTPPNPYPADIINMSLGGGYACDINTQTAINAATANGAVIVAAAGNSSADTAGYTPAGCNNVITVGAHDHKGTRAIYSNYGSEVDLMAPGGYSGISTENISSTYNTGNAAAVSDGYAGMMGTSMAAPHVAGMIGLLLDVEPTMQYTDIKNLLSTTGTTRNFSAAGDCLNTAPYQGNCGSGIADAYLALSALGDIPISPSGLSLHFDGTSIALTWQDNANTETGYQIDYSTDGVNYSLLAGNLSTDTTSYLHNSVSTDNAYYYKVTALGAFVNSASAGAVISTLPAPTQLSVMDATDSTLTLTWSDNTPSDNRQYIYRSTDENSGFVKLGWVSPSSNSTMDYTVSSATTYFYKVTAADANGIESSASNVARATTAQTAVTRSGGTAGWPLLSIVTMAFLLRIRSLKTSKA